MSILQETIQDLLFTDNKYSCNFTPSKRNIDAVNGLPTAPDKSQAASLTIRLVCREVYTKRSWVWDWMNAQADAQLAFKVGGYRKTRKSLNNFKARVQYWPSNHQSQLRR